LDRDARRWLDCVVREHAPTAEKEDVSWTLENGSTIPLHIAYYVGDLHPPQPLVTSVRAVVLSAGKVLTLRNRDGVHALPDGRREPGESYEQTLRREILEESGYTISAPSMLGAVHLRHLGPKPPAYRYVYPDFVWTIYLAACDGRRVAAADDAYELEARFESVQSALQRIDLGSRVYVRAASDAAAA
jgi:ADP-ribose pyrophosphatase YjhB (NUDIX family)